MGNFRDDRGGGGFHRGGRSSFGGNRGFDRGGDRGGRPMFTATCSNCGKECQVPFRPTNGKPVYCSDCFEKMGNRSDSGSGRPERSSFRPQSSGFDSNKAQFEALNAKMDKILSLLQPKVEAPAVKLPETKVDMKEVITAFKKTKGDKRTDELNADMSSDAMKEVKVPKDQPASAKASTDAKALVDKSAGEGKKVKKAASTKK